MMTVLKPLTSLPDDPPSHPAGRSHEGPGPLRSELHDWLGEVQSTFHAAADPLRAQGEKAYLKSELTHVGTGVPLIRATAQGFGKRFKDLERHELTELVWTLWEPPIHELRSLAIALLEVKRSKLTLADLETIEAIVRQSKTWAHVDWLAIKVAGDIVRREPGAIAVLERWAVDDCMWLRRSALLALLEPMRAGGGDFPTFARLAVPRLVEKEFFLRKAIGTILREVAKRRPGLVVTFLDAHLEATSRLTLREAVRHLPARDRERLLAAHAERGPRSRG